MIYEFMPKNADAVQTGREYQVANTVHGLFTRVHRLARLAQIGAKITGKNRRLLDLQAERAAHSVRGSHYAGVRAVALNQIRGSEGRTADFDVNFLPLSEHNRARWSNIATAMKRKVVLPPVELTQLGETYFVRDGHHRISVARALGQKAIDAQVTVLEIPRPQPQAQPAYNGVPSASSLSLADCK